MILYFTDDVRIAAGLRDYQGVYTKTSNDGKERYELIESSIDVHFLAGTNPVKTFETTMSALGLIRFRECRFFDGLISIGFRVHNSFPPLQEDPFVVVSPADDPPQGDPYARYLERKKVYDVSNNLLGDDFSFIVVPRVTVKVKNGVVYRDVRLSKKMGVYRVGSPEKITGCLGPLPDAIWNLINLIVK